MASKLEEFLSTNKLDKRRLVIASQDIESLQPEDRAIKLAKRTKKEDAEKKGPSKKPRSGKPVSLTTLGKIFAGKWVSSPTRTRVLRAVNKLLEQKKQTPVDLGALFDLSVQRPKKKAKPAAAKKK